MASITLRCSPGTDAIRLTLAINTVDLTQMLEQKISSIIINKEDY